LSYFYRFDGFLIELDFFYFIYIYIIKKLILEKNYIIKLYKIIKIKKLVETKLELSQTRLVFSVYIINTIEVKTRKGDEVSFNYEN
jgi:hypothetical protein